MRKLSNSQREVILAALQNDFAVFDFEGLTPQTQQVVLAKGDFETLEHEANRLIYDTIMKRMRKGGSFF